MKKFFPFAIFLSLFIACKDGAKGDKKSPTEDTISVKKTVIENGNDPLIDSIFNFKPATLSISEERSDKDDLIPVGYNDRGSFSYIIDQDMGGASGYEFHITPSYDMFSASFSFDRDEQGDSVIFLNKDLLREALRVAQIKLKNAIDRITVAELEKKYGIKFTIRKNFGLPNKDWDASKKTLASVNISYNRGDGYPTQITNDHYDPSDGIWDKYISDVILVPSKEFGMFAFAVLVTESIGFEGYTRKVIEVVNLGSLNK